MKSRIKIMLNKLILSTLIVIILFQTITPNTVNAKDNEIGTQVKAALFTIVCLPADAIMKLLQNNVIGIKGEVVIKLNDPDEPSWNEMVKEIQDFAVEEGGLTGALMYGGAELATKLGGGFFYGAGQKVSDVFNVDTEWDVPAFLYSPELIFSGMVPVFNIDFFTDNGLGPLTIGGKEVKGTDSGKVLHPIVQNWYKTLRIAAVIALLSILIYAGIKIVLSVSAEQNAKYKEFLKDWIMALVLLGVLHYFMVGMVEISKELSKLLNNGNILSMAEFTIGTDSYGEVIDVTFAPNVNSADEAHQTKIISCRYLGISRFFAGRGEWGYLIIYLVLVVYSLYFTWVYLKRVLYLAFLTLISPLVAFSYPLDKMGDGSAQAFQFWLKEYMFNVLVQPLHLFIYMVIMNSAFDLAESNPLYALVAMGSIFAFEKIVKQMLGFNKAQNTSSLAEGAAIGAIASSLVNSFRPALSSNNSGKKEENTKIRTERKVDSQNKNRDPYSQGRIRGTTSNSINIANNNNSTNRVTNQLIQGEDGEGPDGGVGNNPNGGNTPPDGNNPLGEENGENEKLENLGENQENLDKGKNNEQNLEVGALQVSSLNTETLNTDNLVGNGAQGATEKEFTEPEVRKLLVEKVGMSETMAKSISGISTRFLNSEQGKNIMRQFLGGGTPININFTGGVDDNSEDDDEDDDENIDIPEPNLEEPNAPTPPSFNPPPTPSAEDDYSDEFDDFFDDDDDGNSARRNIPMNKFWARERALTRTGNRRAARLARSESRSERDIAQIKSFAKTAGRFTVGKLPGALLLGTYGLAAGIATGDFSKVVGLTSAGVIGGAAIGGRIERGVEGLISSGIENHRADREEYEKALYGESYTDLQNIKADKDFINKTDKEVEKIYRDAFPIKANETAIAYRQRIKHIKERALEFRSYGITDDKIITKAIKLQDKHKNNPDYQGDNIYDIAKFAVQCPKNEEGKIAFEQRLIRGYSKFFDEEEAEEKARKIMEAIEEMRK